MDQPTKSLIVIAGPTASGKTAAAIRLAQYYHTVIVSADSRQFFREMAIGTAKPTPAELGQAKHYFIDSHAVTEPFSVGDFEKQGLALLDELFKSHDKVILVGGSGLYIKALCEGFDDIPQAEPAIREQLNTELAQYGIIPLQDKLKQADPAYYASADINNPQRVIRALEVYRQTGNPFSSYRKAKVNTRPFNILKIALDLPREVLYNRINKRVDMMVKDGLVDEVETLLPYRHLNALNTVGYSEVFAYLDNKITLDKAVEMIKQNTRRFAKRQLTWFRKDQDMVWLSPDEVVGEKVDGLL
ncbi:tRNA (adenosine(37)-N6)-dimethylallyltransferase MiaA [Mucilaginibacter antarcticus]|uniref:tRNA dimethylallyltransferase n=1 Tax=Mucilaginibacter antarcticus TaxID=1855725 RepID=A0ABW5XRA7_9SPHI